MSARAIVIGAPRSGSGKTSVTIGLLRAFARRGVRVRGAKSGPDYIDPAFHEAATGLAGVNLDSWAMPPPLLNALAAQAAADADLIVLESAMGLFDGIPAPAGRSGAAADLAALYRLPTLLVLDVSGQSTTAAAVAKGFATYRPDVPIAGVVLNRLGSERHRKLCADAIEALGLPVVGAVMRDAAIAMPERHLGLVQAGEHRDLMAFIDRMADMVERSLDLDAVMRLAAPLRPSAGDFGTALAPPGQRIAVARDAAFTFVTRMSCAAGATREPGSCPSRRWPTRRGGGLRRLLAARGYPELQPEGWRLPKTSAPACGPLPGRSRCMASAAASWCWGRRWRMPMASPTACSACSAIPPASPDAGCISATGRLALPPPARWDRPEAWSAATNSTTLR